MTGKEKMPLHEEDFRHNVLHGDKRNSLQSTERIPLLPKSESNYSFTRQILNLFSSSAFTVTTFISLFSLNIIAVSSTSLILDKVCLVHLKYPSYVCSNLDNYTSHKIFAEKMAANYTLIHRMLKIVPSILVAFAAGQWSDKYGRKPFFLIAIFGYAAESLGACLCAYVQNARLEYYFIGTAVMGISGGQLSFSLTLYSYVSDSTTVQKRTMQYAFLEILLGVAQPLSVFVGGWIFNFYGYSTVFLVSTCGFGIVILWSSVFLPEIRGLDNKESWKFKIKSLFSCTNLVDGFVSAFKQRKNNGRQLLWLLIISNGIALAATNSINDINYLYVHHQFSWGNTKYSTVYAFYLTCGIVSLLLLLPVLKYFQVRDPVIGLIGVISIAAKCLGIGLANETLIFHIANVLGVFSGCATIALRSNLSKAFPKDEQGNLFSFVAASESIFLNILIAVVTQLFNIFLAIYAGVPYFFLVVLLIVPFGVLSWILSRNSPGYKCKEYEKCKDHKDIIDET